MQITEISQKVQNVKRLNEILQVFVKYGFGYVVDQLHIERTFIGKEFLKLKILKKIDKITDLPVNERIRIIFEQLGPTFIKLGQILSTRPDLISLSLCQELGKLLDNTPPFPLEEALKIFREEMKSDPGDLFAEFKEKPAAAASLSQVYHGRLKTGEEIIVKVQRPRIEKNIRSDLEILYFLAELIEKYIPESNILMPLKIVEEFRSTILRELDFRSEAMNIERFRKNFRSDETVYIPKVFKNYSSKKLLTMERIRGFRPDDLKSIDTLTVSRKKITQNGAKAVLKQIFRDGFFHADPHPGNLFIKNDGTVVFIDLGMVGRISHENCKQLAYMLASVTEKDAVTFVESLVDINAIDEEKVTDQLIIDVEDILEKYADMPLKDVHLGTLMSEVIRIISYHELKIPSDYFILIKSLITIEGVGKKIDPDFDMMTTAKPFVEDLMKQRYHPLRIAAGIRRFIEASFYFSRGLPKDIFQIVQKVKKGRLRIEFEHKGLDDLVNQLDRVSNRISFSLIIAALIVGSSFIMQTDKGPQLFGFPVLGIIGFSIATFMGLWLTLVIMRSGRM